MRYAFVLAEDGMPLMPTDIRHASRLLKRKEAVIAGHRPFTIRLTRHSEKNVQPVEVCCDAGYAHIGISVKSEKHEKERRLESMPIIRKEKEYGLY